MAAKPWEHADEARAALQAIMTDPGLGPQALSNGALAANALEDLLPDAPRERAVLVLAAKARLAQSLQGHVHLGIDIPTAIRLTAASFEDVSPLDPDACRWVVTELAIALGLLPPATVADVASSPPLAAQASRAAAEADEDTRTASAAAQAAEWAAVVAAASPALSPPVAAPHSPGPPDQASPTTSPRSPELPEPDSPAATSLASAGPAADSPPAPPATVTPPGAQRRPPPRKRRVPGINGVALSPDGRLLATAGADGTVRLWDVIAGTLSLRLSQHAGPVKSVSFSPDGRLLATAGGTDAARLWDVTGGEFVRTITPGVARDVAFSPDGRLLVTAGGGSTHAASMAAATVDRAAWLWEVATGAAAGSVTGPIRHTTAVVFSPDGRLLATAGAGDDVRLWDVATGALAGGLSRQLASAESIAFSPDGRLVATAGDGRPAMLWDVAAGSPSRTITAWPARAVAFSPDGRLLATAGGGRPAVTGVAAGAVLDKAAWVWEVVSGSMVSCLAGHDDQAVAVAFSADSRLVVTSARDRTARIWDLRAPGTPRCEFSGR